MSIFDELLILIEDQTEVGTATIERFLPHYTRQAIGSTLGRLVSRGWLTRQSESGQDLYRVSEPGNTYITHMLDAIHRTETTWSGRWFAVVATLPETQRRERDMLRHYLSNRGFGRLVDGFWIHVWNRQEEVAQLIRRLGIGASVFMFETQPFGQATRQIVIKNAWHWADIEQRLETFITQAGPEVLAIEDQAKTATDPLVKAELRHRAKCVVFEYGMLLAADPTLPLEFAPHPALYKKAQEIYNRVRAFCY